MGRGILAEVGAHQFREPLQFSELPGTVRTYSNVRLHVYALEKRQVARYIIRQHTERDMVWK